MDGLQPPIIPLPPGQPDPSVSTQQGYAAPQRPPKSVKQRIGIGIAIILGGILSVIGGGILLLVVLGLYLGGGLHGNQAQKSMKPIQSQLAQLDAHKLCDNGDNGYGLDNTRPWHIAYYSAPDSSNLTTQITRISSEAGYRLLSDNQYISELKAGDAIYYSDGERYSARNDYLTGTNPNNGSRMDVKIIRDGNMRIACSDFEKYLEPQTAKAGEAMLYLSITYPDRRN